MPTSVTSSAPERTSRPSALVTAMTAAEGQRWPLVVGLAIVVVLSIVDAALTAAIAATFLLGPLLLGTLVGTVRQTTIVGFVAIAAALCSGLWNANTDAIDFTVRAVAVAIGTGLAVAGARARMRLAADQVRFQILSAIADLPARELTGREALDAIGAVVVPAVGDLYAIDTPEGERIAVAVSGARAQGVADGLRGRGARGGAYELREARLVERYGEAELQATAVDEADVAFLRSLELVSSIHVPLSSRGHPLGTMSFGVCGPRRPYDERDLAFAKVLAGRVALTLDNAGLFSEVETLAAQQAAALGSLAEAVTMQDPSGEVVYANEAAARTLGFASVEALLSCTSEEIAGRFASYHEDGSPLDMSSLPGRRVLAGDDAPPLLLRSIDTRTGDERWRQTKASPVYAPDGSVQLVVNVIEDVTEVKRAERAQRVLADAGAALASSVDPVATLEEVARLAIGELGDWCSVTMPGERGELNTVAVAHLDPEKVRAAWDLTERFPPRADDPEGAANVIRTGTTTVINGLTDELLESSVPDAEQLAAVRALGLRSVMIVPIIASGTAVGAISFVWAESHRSFSAADQQLAEELGRRAGVAVAHARLYAERSHIASTLQASLMPDRLPAIPGFSSAALYRPAGGENRAGGDFYDVFETPHGWTVVVGDVTGRGAEAAALTGQARHTLRTAARLLDDPVAPIGELNRALAERGDGSLCTVATLSLAERDGRMLVSVVCAGHPQPFLLRDGTPRPIGRWGPLVGAFAESRWVACTEELEAGDVVVLFTDGVLEACGSDGRLGDERLAAALAGVSGAEGAVERVRTTLEAFETGEHTDDTAVLAVAYTGDRQPVA